MGNRIEILLLTLCVALHYGRSEVPTFLPHRAEVGQKPIPDILAGHFLTLLDFLPVRASFQSLL